MIVFRLHRDALFGVRGLGTALVRFGLCNALEHNREALQLYSERHPLLNKAVTSRRTPRRRPDQRKAQEATEIRLHSVSQSNRGAYTLGHSLVFLAVKVSNVS